MSVNLNFGYSYFNKDSEVKVDNFCNKHLKVKTDIGSELFLIYSFFYPILKQSDYSMSPQPKETGECIIKSVLHPERMRMISEGEPVSSTGKIRRFVRDLSHYIKTPKGCDIPLLTHIEKGRWIHRLVEIIIDEKYSHATKQRAQFALLSLEKIAPGVASWNDQIMRLTLSRNAKCKANIVHRLRRWIETPLPPAQITSPIRPHRVSKDLPDYTSLFSTQKHSGLKISKNSFLNDKRILVGNKDKIGQCFFDNIKQVTQSEGVCRAIEFPIEWVRDPLIFLEKNRYLIPCPMNVGPQFIFGTPPIAHFLERLLGSCESALGIASDVADKLRLFEGHQEAPFYFEGGNLMPATTQTGKNVYLCGASNLLYSVLNSGYLFAQKERRESLLDEMKTLEKLNAYRQKEIDFIRDRLEKGGLLNGFSDKEKEKIAKLTIASISYFRKKMASTLGCKAIQIGNVFKEQPDYHLDLFLMPAPGGVIFIQDHKLCCDVINKILIKHSNHLSSEEKKRLGVYLKKGQKKEKKHGEQLRKITENLRKEGFKVIPVPGAYHLETSQPAANFINAVVGVGKKENTFIITNGSSHPVDRYLRDAFTAFLNHYGVEHVYFAGRKTTGSLFEKRLIHRFSEGDKGLAKAGGVHCRTLEVPKSLENFKPKLLKSPLKHHVEYMEKSLPTFYREILKQF